MRRVALPLLAAVRLVALAAPARADLREEALAASANLALDATMYHRCGATSSTPWIASPEAGTVPYRPRYESPWEIRLSIVGWIPGVSGKVAIGGAPGDVDYDWTDWFQILDKVEFAFQGAAEVRYRGWMVQFQGMRAVIGDSVPIEASLGPISIERILEAEVELRLFRAVFGREIGRTCVRRGPCPSVITWTAYAGVRYFSLGVEAALVNPADQSERRVERTRDWYDPLVGFTAWMDYNPRWSFLLDVDVGGFGVGSDLSWKVQVGASWHATRWLAVDVGWKFLDIDYTTGRGDTEFKWNIFFSGPYVGAAVVF